MRKLRRHMPADSSVTLHRLCQSEQQFAVVHSATLMCIMDVLRATFIIVYKLALHHTTLVITYPSALHHNSASWMCRTTLVVSSLAQSCLHSLAQSCLHSLAQSCLHSLAQSCLHSLAQSCLHSLAQSSLHSLAQSCLHTNRTASEHTRMNMQVFPQPHPTTPHRQGHTCTQTQAHKQCVPIHTAQMHTHACMLARMPTCARGAQSCTGKTCNHE